MQRPLLVLLHRNDSHVLQAKQSESVLKSFCSTTAAKQEKYCKVEKTFGQMLFLWLVIWLLHAWKCVLFMCWVNMQHLSMCSPGSHLLPWAPAPSLTVQDPARLCCACQPSLQSWVWPHTGLAVHFTGSSHRLLLCAGQGLTPSLVKPWIKKQCLSRFRWD